MHRGKVDPEGSELPQGNELSRDHVNRPLEITLLMSNLLKQANYLNAVLKSLKTRGLT